jgi:hypothetical protein
MLIDMHNVVSFVLSTNGKLLINLHQSGDLLVYNLENHLSALSKRIVTDTKVNHNAFNDEQKGNREGLVDIQMKVNKLHTNFFMILFLLTLLCKAKRNKNSTLSFSSDCHQEGKKVGKS